MLFGGRKGRKIYKNSITGCGEKEDQAPNPLIRVTKLNLKEFENARKTSLPNKENANLQRI